MTRLPRKRRETCVALDFSGTECGLPTVDDALWCPRHNEERLKLYTNYKAHHALLDAVVDNAACNDAVAIMACTALLPLKEWNDCLRVKYNLLTRGSGLLLRVLFRQGHGMMRCAALYIEYKFTCMAYQDFGHKTFWASLVRKRAEIERLMYHVEKRAYQLILQAQNALWVLDRDLDAHESVDCSGYDDESVRRDASFQSTDGDQGTVIEDPLETALREKAIEFREKIRSRLVRYCAPSASKYHAERLEVISAYVRRVIFTEPALMLLSQSYDSVMALLSDDNLDLVTLEKIWTAIKNSCVHDVRDAVDDVLRANDEGDYVMVLGVLFLPPLVLQDGTYLCVQFVSSIKCPYSTYRMDEIIAMTRFVLFSQTSLSLSCLKYANGFDGAKELILAGFIPRTIPLSSPRHSITCTDNGSYCPGPTWEETKSNLSLYGALSLNDPKAQAFVNACIRHPDLMVMVRKGAGGRVICSRPVVWTSRKRRARSQSGLASVPWEKTRDVVHCQDGVLEAARPSGWKHPQIADCLMVVLVDGREGNMGDFVRKLVEIWCRVYRVEDREELYCVLERPFVEAGELEKCTCCRHEITFTLPTIHGNVVSAYDSLWRTVPPPWLLENPNRFRLATDSF
ncbi:hypothetical protein AZE42_05879 [Rhizopogon vesiculosus]|uniref:Uncharacterized protein n=1 Tax=Rhizopogon vesiculosus TaxID=180088 RepID=A0A1J8R955_9AGAM|nr:hypothetical protein AZE42_05879 [Rhizopogon vesiculosus]